VLGPVQKKAAVRKNNGGAKAEETPLAKKLLVPLILVALAYGINYYFTHQ
jgi:hypothetical protein